MIFKNMKKKLLMFLLAISLVGYGQNWARAERLSIHVSGGFSSPSLSNIKTGFETGFGFALGLNKKITISFNFGFWKSQVDEKAGQLKEGNLTVTPFLAEIQYSFPGGKKFAPYVLLGAGFVFSNFALKDLITIPEIRISQKIENGPALEAGLGSQMLLSPKLAVFAEALYLYHRAEATTTISDLNFGLTEDKFNLNMSAFLISLGIKYYL